MAECVKCGATLSFNEVGLNRKLIDMEPKEWLCKPCLAAHFRCNIELLDQKIRQYQYLGCTLFEEEE